MFMKTIVFLLYCLLIFSCSNQTYSLPIQIAHRMEALYVTTPDGLQNDDPLFDRWIRLPKTGESGNLILTVGNVSKSIELRMQVFLENQIVSEQTFSLVDARRVSNSRELVLALKIQDVGDQQFVRWTKVIATDAIENVLTGIAWQSTLPTRTVVEFKQSAQLSEVSLNEPGSLRLTDTQISWQFEGGMTSFDVKSQTGLDLFVDTGSRQKRESIELSTQGIAKASIVNLEVFSRQSILVPKQLLASDFSKVTLDFADSLRDFKLGIVSQQVNDLSINQPILSDLGAALLFSQNRWRSTNLESFRWNRFPNVVLLDFASASIQDLYVKRMVFFVEKKRFRGSILSNNDLAGRHGWNANNFRPQDLAAFFNTVSETGFELNQEELWLKESLVSWGILKREPTNAAWVAPGIGGLISIARGMAPSTREKLLNHEALHGVFYELEQLQTISRRLLRTLSREAREFFFAFFDFMSYDVSDDYLMVNEFQAYLLQQPLNELRAYLSIMANRLDSIGYRGKQDYSVSANLVAQELEICAKELANFLVTMDIDHQSLSSIKRFRTQ